jgi:predicted  nucleic acid-binding Zn-ribbon protein
MTTQVHQLYKLQETDLEIQQKKQRLGEVLRILKGPEWLLTPRRAHDTAVATLQERQLQHNNLNLERQSLRSKIQDSETRLYSGKISKTKELTDLQQEIESLNRRLSILEDEVLEAMMLVEEAEGERQTAVAALQTAESRWQTESVTLQTEQNELALRLHKLMATRKTQAAAIDAPSLNEYDQLAKKKGGVAIARVRVDMCLGCRMTISANNIKQAKEGKKAYCGGCGRILYPYD